MKRWREFLWILPLSLGLGVMLSLLDGAAWERGWPGYSLLSLLGISALAALWRAEGSSRSLGWVLLTAFLLRLGLGIFLAQMLPVYGYDNEANSGGYIYRDASTYDLQAWGLAVSDDPLWQAFDRSDAIEEQYGGLTLTLSLAYRLLSPDAHRPALTILLAALVNAIGVGFAWRGLRSAYGEKVAVAASWMLAVYPEAVLTGCSQIREPFLLLFIAMLFWAATQLKAGLRLQGWGWLAGSVLGLFLFSPPVAGSALLITGIWFWLFGSERKVKWGWLVGIVVAAGLAFLLFGYIAGGALQVSSGPLANIVRWLQYSAEWNLYGARQTSDGLQPLFDALPEFLHLPLVTVYGVFQPVLPAAIADPAPWPVWFIVIFRALGWYLLLPLLVFAPFIGRSLPKGERLAWGWLCLAAWAWILVASFRAGGDQWDNPRYRLILLFFQALLAGQAWLYWRASRNVWFGRVLLIEGGFLVVFGYWYAGRYSGWLVWRISLSAVLIIILGISLVILFGGWLWDRRSAKGK